MSLQDKNILITPNIGSSTDDPKIVFSGADATTSAQNITLKAYPTSNGTLSFEGSAGQLFSITNSLTGTIYSVNDVSGIPSIEVLDTGLVKLAQYSGNVLLGTGTDNGTDKLQVNGTIRSSGSVSATSGTFSGTLGVTGAATLANTLTVTGAATFANTVGITGTLTTGVLNSTSGTFSGTLGVTGAATFANTVGVSGTLTTGVLNSTSGTFSGTLGVTGAATFANTVGITGALTTGIISATSGTFSGTLGVTGAATFANTVGIPGTLTTGVLNSTSGTFSGTLGVTGAATFADTVGIAGALTATSGTFNSTLGVTGATTLANTLTVTGTATFTDDLYVNGTYIYGDNKTIIMYSDTWLRLNPNNAFTSGIYAGTGILRTDGNLQVGNAGATLNVSGASFTYLSNNIWHAGNDGSGSGLDADLLDGIDSSRFSLSAYSTFTSGDWNTLVGHGIYKIQHSSFASDTNYPPATYSYGVLVVDVSEIGGESRTLQVYYPHAVSDKNIYQRMFNNGGWTAWSTIWRNGSGSGSTLDADLLDGQHGSYYQNASNISTGTLILARGGTNAALTATAGAVAYSNSTSIALTAVGTSGYVLLSGGTSTPTWSSQASLSVGTANNVSGGTVTATSGTFSGTLGVTGAATFANTVGITGTLTTGDLNSTSGTFSSTLGVTGAATFANTVDITGALTATSGRITKELEIGNTSIYANTQTISTASSNTIIDAFYTSEYSTSKYVISYKSTSNTTVFGSTEILVMHNGSTVITSEYSTMYGTDIAFSVDAAIVGSKCNIYASANQGNLVVSTTRFSMV